MEAINLLVYKKTSLHIKELPDWILSSIAIDNIKKCDLSELMKVFFFCFYSPEYLIMMAD